MSDAEFCSDDLAPGGRIGPSIATVLDPDVAGGASLSFWPAYERPALDLVPMALMPDPIGPRRHLLFGSFLL